ncbi:uncharacterized protein LOC114828350 [Galendromus occidentalis]|uniref:Uncharacterized protein LOC114828350 n=1 Tax=Galendromus occidentalis TaxID=34638 RepID=A0AAJ7SFW0_9ACAR|nr:uncharacterized protein LOC114828350 [Galendromus occidentalis]
MGVHMASNKLLLVYGLAVLVFFRLVVTGAEASSELKKKAAKQEGQVVLDNRQIIPGWGGPVGPWGGWPWYGGMSTVMFAALIYSLSVLPAMLQLFNHYHSYHHHGPPHRSPVSNFVNGFLGIKRRSDDGTVEGGNEFDLPDTLLRMATSDTLGKGFKIAKNIVTEWPSASNDCKAMYICQLTREAIQISSGDQAGENEVRQKRNAEGRSRNQDECVTKFKKCRRDVLFS